MNSIAFPKMFSNTNTLRYKDHEATLSNLKLLLGSTKTGLFGDPYFGTNIKKLMFEQNNNVLRDIVIDEIFTVITTFMPQITIKRNDIEVVSNRETVYINIKATNLLDFKTDLYTINLMDTEGNY